MGAPTAASSWPNAGPVADYCARRLAVVVVGALLCHSGRLPKSWQARRLPLDAAEHAPHPADAGREPLGEGFPCSVSLGWAAGGGVQAAMNRVLSAVFWQPAQSRERLAPQSPAPAAAPEEAAPAGHVPPVELPAAAPAPAWGEDVDRRHRAAIEQLHEDFRAAAQQRRSRICKHQGPCATNALWLAARAGLGGFAAKALLEAAVALLRKRSLAAAGQALSSRDTARFALFLSAMVGGAAGTRCLLVWLRGRDDRLNAAVAGAVAGAASLLDSPARRRGVALYLLVRSLYALVHALMRRRVLTRIPGSATALFASANALIMYAFIAEPQLLDRSYYAWMLRTANITGAVISYTMRETRLGIHPGVPGVTPTPPGCSCPDPAAVSPASGSPAGVDVLSGVVELAALLGAAAGAPAPRLRAGLGLNPAAAPSASAAFSAEATGGVGAGVEGAARDRDAVLSYSAAMNTPLDATSGALPELSDAAGGADAPSLLGPARPVQAGASASAVATGPLTTSDGSVTEVGSGAHHFGFHTTGKAVREATGVDFMTANGWGDLPGGGRQLRKGGGGSTAIARLYSAAELGVSELWATAPAPDRGARGDGAPAPRLRLVPAARERVWRAALPPDQRSRRLPSQAELAARGALLRQAPPRALLPGVPCGPAFFRRCDEVYHPGESCAVAHAKDLPALVGRCLRLYAPVHLVPLLLFRARAAIADPVNTSIRAATAIARSTAFLTTYVSVVKASLCLERNVRTADSWWQASLAGVLSGLALSFEAPKRASELMLYCLPKGLDVGFQLLERRGLVKRMPYGSVVMFSAAMAIVLALDRSDFRPAYSSLLGLLFGNDQSTFNSDPVAAGTAVRSARRALRPAPPGPRGRDPPGGEQTARARALPALPEASDGEEEAATPRASPSP